MSPAEILIADLALLNVQLVVDGENLHYQGPKGAVTSDHLRRLKALKPEIRERLIEQEGAIRWRMRIMLATDPPRYDLDMFWPDEDADGNPLTTQEPGRCSSCDEPQPYDQDGKCVLCALASYRVHRIERGLEPRPVVDEPVRPERPRLPSWTCRCGGNAVGELLVCLFCKTPRHEGEMYTSQQALLENAS